MYLSAGQTFSLPNGADSLRGLAIKEGNRVHDWVQENSKLGSQQQFKFPQLPPELRNEIYALVSCEDITAHLSAKTNSRLVSPLPLLQVSRQLRYECLPVLSLIVPEIITTVRNLDFGPIIQFFTICGEADLKTLAGGSLEADGPERRMTVKVLLTEEPHYFVDRVRRCINRFARPAKKSTAVKVDSVLDANRWEDRYRFRDIVHDMHGRYENETQLDELERMFAAR